MHYNKPEKYISPHPATPSSSKSSSSATQASVNPACWCATSKTTSPPPSITQSALTSYPHPDPENEKPRNRRQESAPPNCSPFYMQWDTAGQDRFRTITSTYYKYTPSHLEEHTASWSSTMSPTARASKAFASGCNKSTSTHPSTQVR